MTHHRGHVLPDEHGDAHQDREYVGRVVSGESADPEIDAEEPPEANEGRVLDVDGYGQCHVERVEDRDLHHHRQAAAERVHLVGPVELHRLPLQALGIALVLRPQRIDLRLERLHCPHRRHALDRQREEENLGDHGEQDDGHTVVVRELVEPVHQPEDGHGQPLHWQAAVVLWCREPTQIYGLFEPNSDGCQPFVFLWADLALHLAFPDLTGPQRGQMNSQTDLAQLDRLWRVDPALADLRLWQLHSRATPD